MSLASFMVTHSNCRCHARPYDICHVLHACHPSLIFYFAVCNLFGATAMQIKKLILLAFFPKIFSVSELGWRQTWSDRTSLEIEARYVYVCSWVHVYTDSVGGWMFGMGFWPGIFLLCFFLIRFTFSRE